MKAKHVLSRRMKWRASVESLEERVVLSVGPELPSVATGVALESVDNCGCNGELISIDADASGTLAPGGTLPVTVRLHFNDSAAAYRVRVTPAGALGGAEQVRTFAGPFLPNAEATWAVGVPSAEGEGFVTARLETLDASGHTVEAIDATLYAVVRDGKTWTSDNSLAAARIRRLDDLLAAGALDAAAYGESADRVGSSVVPVTASISVLAAGNFTVAGKVQWTDGAGGLHPVPLATVEIRDKDLVGSELVTTITTDMAGNYTATFTHDDGPLQGDPDLFVRVLAQSTAAKIRPDSLLSSVYSIESPVQDEVPTGSSLTVNLTAGNVLDNERAFSVHHALVFIAGYAGEMVGTMPSQIDTVFPVPGSFFDGSKLAIRGSAAFEWDVIHHEYGHYVARTNGIDNSPGGHHGTNENLAVTNGTKSGGIRMAWSEGWATYFAISGQVIKNAAALAIPQVGDAKYQSFGGALTIDLESPGMLGEDNEETVMANLWDVWDTANEGDDKSTMSDKTLFSTLKSASVTTLGAAWEALAAGRDNKGKAVLGGLFGQDKVAPVLKGPADNVQVKASDPPLKFEWDANGGGVPNPLNSFKLKFYSEDFATLVKEIDVGNVTSYTPTAAEWTAILGGGAVVRYVVEGKNTTAPATPGGTLGYYWSKPRALGAISIVLVIDDTGSMGEEIASVRAALQAYIDTVQAALPAGATPPTIQLITFKDSVTTRITSSDLAAVRAAVGALSASGGGDCPEFSAHAMQRASENIAPGGTILFATDASAQPGVDMGAVLAKLTAAGVTVNTILSGDCSGIDSTAGLSAEPGPSLAAAAIDPGAAIVGPILASHEPSPLGDNEPPGGPIVDPGQPPLDSDGNTAASASRITVAMPPTRGLIGLDLDTADVYIVALDAGVKYAIRAVNEGGASFTLKLLGSDATSTIDSRSVSGNSEILFTPTTAGDYYLEVTRLASTAPTSFSLDVVADPLAGVLSAVELFSTVSAQTGGAFSVHDEVNTGDSAAYEAALYNVMVSTLGPAVLSANPATVPQGQTLAVTLTGRKTNWRAGVTTVAFPDGGITVNSVEVNSATTLTVIITVAAGAPLIRHDVVVTTPLGTATETAQGRDVLLVGGPITGPTLLSVEPSTVAQDTTLNVLIRGANTAWDATSTLTLGPGIVINSVTVESPTQLRASVTIKPGADIGFRTATVTTTGQGTQSVERALFVNSTATILPQIIDISPASSRQGRSLDVAIRGEGTSFVNGITTASFGDGITVESVLVTDPTTAVVHIVIAPGAALGFRTVQMTTGAETAVLLNSFFVDETLAEITDVSPSSGGTGTVVDVTITGANTGFSPGVTTASFGPGIDVQQITVISPSSAVVRVVIASDAALGAREVVLTTNGQVVRLADGFTVLVGDTIGPRVVNVTREGVHWQPTTVVIRFNEALAAATAAAPASYRIFVLGPHGYRRAVKVAGAQYDAATNTVHIRPAKRLSFQGYHQIEVSAVGLTDVAGNALDGDGDGQPGGDYRAVFHRGGLVAPVRRLPLARPTRTFTRAVPSASLARHMPRPRR